MMKSRILTIVLLFWVTAFFTQIPPVAPEQSQSILISGVTIHIGNGKKLVDGSIGFKDGKIDYVGSNENANRAAYDLVINADGKHVYPGFIAPNSNLGLIEIGAVRASKDYREVGDFNPHIRSVVAYNTESRITTTVRSNGVLIGQICPRGGTISGKSSVVQFDAWDWEEAIISEDEGLHLNWPRMKKWSWKERKVIDNKKYKEQKDKIEKFITDAKHYCDQQNVESKNIRMEAMRPYFAGEQTLYLHATKSKEILDAISFCKALGLKKIVLVDAEDAWRVADAIKDNNISVMIPRTHSLPNRPDEDVDLPYKMAKILQDANILFCLQNAGDMAEMNTRNLPFLAGTCVTYGLTEEQAVASITLNPAKILGIDKEYGSLEVGKSATLFISTGDALDMMTNNVERAFIDGRDIDLNNPQKMLYEKFQMRK